MMNSREKKVNINFFNIHIILFFSVLFTPLGKQPVLPPPGSLKMLTSSTSFHCSQVAFANDVGKR